MRRARRAVLALLLLAAATSPLWAPPLGRRIPWFAARRVEVLGARLLPPHQVLRAGGLGVGVNVWADPAPFEAALRRNPAVASARVTRVLPHTLRVRIVEKTPAALVQAGTLRPATGAGEVLAVDPARGQVDLPLLAGAVRLDRAGRVQDAAARAALAETARLAAADPALMARVSEVRPGPRGELTLELSQPAARVWLPARSDAATLARLRAVLARLGESAPDSAGARAPLLDARFDDQVVVRPAG